ncbi:MAG TPA: hypothetical protein DIC34_07925 [Treponema sp.]|nr:MAG: hypothetical protein A2001_00365 [Treponema sp. GWC1_61_84]HCM26452.1 hypothetical protein [Treponema sp.]
MMTIGEFSLRSGLGAKTLRYYDEVGLLRPARIEEKNGYRLYDEACLERARRMLIWRECGFSLDEIKLLLDASGPGENIIKAIGRQIGVLRIRRDEIDSTIRRLEEISVDLSGLKGNEPAVEGDDAPPALINRLRSISDALTTTVATLNEMLAPDREAP